MSGTDGRLDHSIIRQPPRLARAALVAATLSISGSGPPAYAVESLDLRLGSLSGAGWQADGIGLRLQLEPEPGSGMGLLVTVRRLRLDSVAEAVHNLRLQCPGVELTESRLACMDGRLQASHPALQASRMGLDFVWEQSGGHLDLRLRELRVAGGRVGGELTRDASGWRSRIRTDGVRLAALQGLLKTFTPALTGWALQGELDLTLDLQAAGGLLTRLGWDARIRGFDFSDPAGAYLGQGLRGAGRGWLDLRLNDWGGSAELELRAGELLTPAFYLAPGAQPVTLTGDLRVRPDSRTLSVTGLQYRHPGVLDLDASAELGLGSAPLVRRLNLTADAVPLDQVYGQYARPLLGAGILAKLALAGTARIDIDYGPAASGRVIVGLQNAGVQALAEGPSQPADEAEAKRASPFGFSGVNGHLVWTRDAPGALSSLLWQRGHVLEKLELGGGELEFRIAGDGFVLEREAAIPVLDGSLLVSRFSFSPPAASKGGLEFEGVLTPVSMEAVSRALDWPPLSGKLSGVIPSIAYRDGSLQVNGNLLVRVFDGDILVRDLRMEDLFGFWPVVTADVELKNLDLEMLTGTFAFGKITGRLEGRADALRLENWSPVAFDARFATPEGDKSRHRISQRAVDNIADLGGAGVSGAVSRGVLRYFDEFGYSRLGISCRLNNGVCEMGGVRSAGQGYYLIEGGGVPRIEIIGFNRRTDWNLLLQQLKEITRGQAPVIE